jgi:hypothetical protein
MLQFAHPARLPPWYNPGPAISCFPPQEVLPDQEKFSRLVCSQFRRQTTIGQDPAESSFSRQVWGISRRKLP